MKHVYLDWNVFDRIEKLDQLEKEESALYNNWKQFLLREDVVSPYSNAHLNDLLRGFRKNPTYIDGHLEILSKITNNLCICQYWSNDEVTWHYRDPTEFFAKKREEMASEAESFVDLLSNDDAELMGPFIKIFRQTPLPNDFKKSYQDPFFGIMFPKSKLEPNLLSVCEDLYQFSMNLKSDYSLYRRLKSQILTGVKKLGKKHQPLIKSLNVSGQELPKHLELEYILDAYTPTPKPESSKNLTYSRIIDTFFKYDLKGYKTDKNFNNMFDDALHSFYGAHCEVFVTNDDRCHYKAQKTFERLGIETMVIKANEIELVM